MMDADAGGHMFIESLRVTLDCFALIGCPGVRGSMGKQLGGLAVFRGMDWKNEIRWRHCRIRSRPKRMSRYARHRLSCGPQPDATANSNAPFVPSSTPSTYITLRVTSSWDQHVMMG